MLAIVMAIDLRIQEPRALTDHLSQPCKSCAFYTLNTYEWCQRQNLLLLTIHVNLNFHHTCEDGKTAEECHVPLLHSPKGGISILD